MRLHLAADDDDGRARDPGRPPARQADEAVVDQHVVAGPQHLADHRGRDRQLAVDRDLLADDEDLFVLQQHARRGQVADPELRSLQIGDQRERLADLFLHLAHDACAGGVIVLRAVREVQADRVDSRLRRDRA